MDKTAVSHQVDTIEKSKKYLGGESLSWKELSEKSRSNIGHSSALNLADDWKVSAESLYALGIGFAEHAYTFPMRNAEGETVGIRTRQYKDSHSKHCLNGSHLGLFIPEGVTRGNVQMVCEGESDTAAAVTLEFAAIGRPGQTACLEEAVRFLSYKLSACPCVVADNSEDSENWAAMLTAALVEAGIPCRLLRVRDPYKDLRDWLTGGLTTKQLVKAIEAQEISYPPEYPQGFCMMPYALIRKGLMAKIGCSAFSVLECLAAFANKNGVCWPGREKVAELTGLSPRTVDRCKNELKECGLLRWKKGKTNRANVYAIDLGPIKGSLMKYLVRPALLPDFGHT